MLRRENGVKIDYKISTCTSFLDTVTCDLLKILYTLIKFSFSDFKIQGVQKICPTSVFFRKWVTVDGIQWNFTSIKTMLWEILGHQTYYDILNLIRIGLMKKYAPKYRIAEQIWYKNQN